MLTKIIVYCLLLHIFVLSVGGVTMTLNPQVMVVGSSTATPVTMLEMRCSSDGSLDIKYLIQMKILRRKFTETSFTDIAFWNFMPGSLNGETQLYPNLPQDILSRTPNVSASIDSSQRSGVLVVTMNGQGLTCSNQAEFNCSLSYTDLSTNVIKNSELKNFTVTATPNDVLMDSAEYYDTNGNMLQLTNNMQLNVGTRIKYKCTANIGSLATGEIIWDRSPQLQGSNTLFIPYTPTITTDIVQEDPQLQQDGCSYKRISTMYYNLTSNDYDGITFRCRARSYLGNQWYEAVSNQQYRTVAVRGSGGNAGGNASGLSGTTSEAGVIAGAVIGAIAGIVLLIILVYFLWYRRRGTGESYRTKEEGERPEPPPTDYTYATADKKNKDGYDNKGLEEPHEKTTRYPRSGRGGFDYRDGRNDGGHHNSGMDDEDGGTMHMSHGPIGTGV